MEGGREGVELAAGVATLDASPLAAVYFELD